MVHPTPQLNEVAANRQKFAPGLAMFHALMAGILFIFSMPAVASDFNQPWRNTQKALVLDAYELNALDWEKIIKNPRIVGFINKATDGRPEEYCTGRMTLCGAKWRKYSVTRELYHTRKTLAKTLGLKWGAYHLGRAGDPEEQARHFLRFANPQPDEVIVLDIESMDSSKFMSLSEAEVFVRHIHAAIDRYPMLYTNHNTAEFIAKNRSAYPLLSRLKLWYARYKDDIRGVFPLGNWDKPDLWQFAYGGNCTKKSCPYRVDGTPRDIDVNVSSMSVAKLREAWPFDGLVDQKPLTEEPSADIIYVNNSVAYPEEEKHSDYVSDPDYADSGVSEMPVSAIGQTSSKKIICEAEIAELDSDALEHC